MSYRRALGSFVAHANADRWLLLRAFIWLAFVDVALRLRGFQRVVASAAAPAHRGTPAVSPEALRRARRYARRIESAARRHVVRAHCLHRSLVLHLWLQREGLPSELRIGVLKDQEALKAHAWVELAGHVVNDRPAAIAPFTPLSGPHGAGAQQARTQGGPWTGPASAGRDVWRS